MRRKTDTLIINAGEFLTIEDNGNPRRKESMQELNIIKNGAVAISGGKIIATGETKEIKSRYKAKQTISANGRLITPGLVDPHTHLIFAGSRENEFEQRIQGKTYMQILQEGGGILSTVRMVRQSSLKELTELARQRIKEIIRYGTTTMEVKSGYGLSFKDEVKSLEVVKRLNKLGIIDLVPTFLGAHEIPSEYRRRKDKYIQLIIKRMLPLVAKKRLARFCDVFCEDSVFTRDESKLILSEAKRLGLRVKIHAEEFSNQGAVGLACELNAISADHLVFVNDLDIALLKHSNTTAVLLPGSSFFLGKNQYAPARKLIDAGCAVALGSDFNPGSSMTFNMQLIMSIACIQLKMTPAEAWVAATLNAGYAIGMEKQAGSIDIGKKADLIIWDAPNYAYVPYHYGINLVNTVIKNGKIVYSSN